MKIKFALLAIFSLSSTLVVAVNPASAGEGGNARFKFAPNIYRVEGARVPPSHYNNDPVHSVRSGSVPKGSNFLGVDPRLLAKPVTQVAAQPSFTQTSGQVMAPKTQFHPSFGKPVQPASPVVAALPPAIAPALAQPKSLLPKSFSAKPAARSARGRGSRASKDVHAVLARRPQANGLSAKPAQAIESYGKNVGYVPGSFLPASSSDGMQTQTSVQGQLLRH